MANKSANRWTCFHYKMRYIMILTFYTYGIILPLSATTACTSRHTSSYVWRIQILEVKFILLYIRRCIGLFTNTLFCIVSTSEQIQDRWLPHTDTHPPPGPILVHPCLFKLSSGLVIVIARPIFLLRVRTWYVLLQMPISSSVFVDPGRPTRDCTGMYESGL